MLATFKNARKGELEREERVSKEAEKYAQRRKLLYELCSRIQYVMCTFLSVVTCHSNYHQFVINAGGGIGSRRVVNATPIFSRAQAPGRATLLIIESVNIFNCCSLRFVYWEKEKNVGKVLEGSVPQHRTFLFHRSVQMLEVPLALYMRSFLVMKHGAI